MMYTELLVVRDELKGELVSWRASHPSEAIVLEIAERTDVNPLDLPPLYESFDPEALDRLIQGQNSCRVTFTYAGYEVTVARTGHIALHEHGSDCSGENS